MRGSPNKGLNSIERSGKHSCAHVQVSEEGKVLRMLMDTDGQNVATVAAVSETDSQLFMGNLGGDYVSVLDKKLLPPVFR